MSPLSSDADTSNVSAVIHPSPSRVGDLCPRCGEGPLDYNGLLLLECTKCGYQAVTPSACTC